MAGRDTRGNGTGAPVTIVVRRDEAEEHAHHGGAWKVAYADFVTAMMAFFMLMWLLNATTEVQRTGLADYFAPTNLFGRSNSGSGKPFGGQTPNDTASSTSTDGNPKAITGHQSAQPDVEEDASLALAMSSVRQDPELTSETSAGDAEADADDDGSGKKASRSLDVASKPGQGRQVLVQGGDYAAARVTPPPPGATQATEAARLAAAVQSDAQREQAALNQAGAQLKDAIQRDPALKEAAPQMMIDTVPEGLRIQIVDADRSPMFGLGSSTPTPRIRLLLQKVVPALAGLPNPITIAGHTDSLTYRGQEKGNWELSTERANATRRILIEAGLADDRVRSVTGNADRDLLLPAKPLDPVNRRITIIVLRFAGGEKAAAPNAPAK